MKSILLKSLIYSALLLGCKNQNKTEQHKPQTPMALQENGSKEYSFSKRDYNREDLVESLYSGLADTTAELKDIEKQIKYLADAKTDSLKDFNNFNQKNTSYYSSADQHINQIKDSILRENFIATVKNSQIRYNAQIAKYNDLTAMLNSKAVTLDDLHTILKIVKTLPVIEKYQRDHMPNTNSINNVLTQYNKTIQQVEPLTKP